MRTSIAARGAVMLGVSTLAGCGNGGVFGRGGREGRDTAGQATMLFVIAGAVFAVVLALLLVAAARSSRQPDGDDLGGVVDGRTGPGWLTVIGGAVLPTVVLSCVLLVTLPGLTAASARDADLTVRVIGHRWWWEVQYPDFQSANELHVPVGTKVRLELTSDDVIHSLWVPGLAGKRDAIPGSTTTLVLEALDAGSYGGSCAEYCGLQHTNMDITVVAQEPDEYADWVEHQRQEAPAPRDGLAIEGQQVFLGSSCVYCHRVRGTNADSDFGPDLTHLASRRTIGAGLLPNTPGNLAGWVLDAQHLKPGNAMPPFTLDGDQLQALLAYLETLE